MHGGSIFPSLCAVAVADSTQIAPAKRRTPDRKRGMAMHLSKLRRSVVGARQPRGSKRVVTVGDARSGPISSTSLSEHSLTGAI
jgi:hypothetical protein